MLIIKKGSAKSLNKLINAYRANSIFLVLWKNFTKDKIYKGSN